MKNISKRIENLRKEIRIKAKKVSVTKHFLIIFTGILFSSVTYLLIFKNLPLHFKNPPTTTINWFTINNYPRQQEFFYFLTGFSYIFSLTCAIWLLALWKRKIK